MTVLGHVAKIVLRILTVIGLGYLSKRPTGRRFILVGLGAMVATLGLVALLKGEVRQWRHGAPPLRGGVATAVGLGLIGGG